MGKTKNIAVTYEKGGVGKTTTAVNLSAILAEKGFRVLLVDLDPQSYATSYYDLYDDSLPSITGVMMGKNKAREAIRPTGIENLDLLPGSYDFRDIETFLMMKTRRQEYTLREAMADVSSAYDYIFMDCPPSGNRIKTNALAFANYVLLPTIPDDYAIHGLLCMANELVEIRQGVNPSLDVLGVLITIYEKTANKKAYSEALQGQDIFPCFHTLIRKNSALSAAINAHKPINLYARRSNGCVDYTALADEIIQRLEGENIYGEN